MQNREKLQKKLKKTKQEKPLSLLSFFNHCLQFMVIIVFMTCFDHDGASTIRYYSPSNFEYVKDGLVASMCDGFLSFDY